jgi:hypothetical protein
MGDFVRARVLRALGLGALWVQLDALSTRLRRVEGDLEAQADLQRKQALEARLCR